MTPVFPFKRICDRVRVCEWCGSESRCDCDPVLEAKRVEEHELRESARIVAAEDVRHGSGGFWPDGVRHVGGDN